jgi:creatinine amidohydrolase
MANSRRTFLQAIAATGTAGIGSEAFTKKAEAGVLENQEKYIDPKSVLLYECTSKEIRERITSGALKLAIIPTGATEQHNEHLAMIMDTAAALLVSQNAALAFFPKVIVTTPLPIGISQYWMKRHGTLTLRPETFIGYIRDICASILTHGISNVLIVNGHGGNAKPLSEAVSGIRNELDMNIEAVSYWQTMPRDQTLSLMESGDFPGHASEFETAFALAAFPQRVRRVDFKGDDPMAWNPDPRNLEKIGWYRAEFDVPGYDKDHYSDSLLATREKGEKCIGIAVEGVKKRIEKMLI